VKRYKRFLADVRLAAGRMVTAHCPNSGSMTACCEAGRPVYLSRHDNPKRKLKYTWELIDMPESMVGVNTSVPNRLVRRSIAGGLVKELRGYERIVPEIKADDHTRLDLLLEKGGGERCYVEIKNCTLVVDREAAFPDAVTTRGLKHLVTLENLCASGHRCVMFYLVQRMDAGYFTPADRIDPQYGKMLRRVVDSGVEILVYDVDINLERIRLNRRLPYRL
jgi:sugar fermentation stimulation protein A